jgi:multiple sugar transport system permease protein
MTAKKKVTNPLEKGKTRWGYFFILPGIIGFLLFYLGPMLFSMFVSTKDWNIITPMVDTGLNNYKTAFADPLTWKSLVVTFYYTALTVPLITIFGFFIALLLNTKVKGISFFRTIFYLPSIIPIVATSAIWMFMYNPTYGLLNGILRSIGLPTMNFIYSKEGVIPSLAMMGVWSAGNAIVIYLAGLQGLSAQLYEAAKIDGAKSYQTFWRITVPLMTPIIFYNVIMTAIGCLQTFTQAFIMTNGGPANSSMFLSLLIYRNAFKFQRMGYAAALSWILFVFVGLFTLLVFKSSRKWVYYETGGDE